MKRFHFPLERVLALRRLERDRETAKLEAALGAQRAIERKLEDIGLEQSRTRDLVIHAADAADADATDLAAIDRWARDLRGLRQKLLADFSVAERATALQRQAVVSSERRVRLLERLESARLRDWRGAAGREVESTAQELWLARWKR